MKKGFLTVLFMAGITLVFISILAWVNETSRDRIQANQRLMQIQSILYAANMMPPGVDEENLSPGTTTDEIPWKIEAFSEIRNQNFHEVYLPMKTAYKSLLKNSYLSFQDSIPVLLVFNPRSELSAYGFPLKGKGLWGTISAFCVISSDLTRMIGIDFTDQVETPGLGARITETEFKFYFRNLDLTGFTRGEPNPIDMVRNKEKSNKELCTSTVQAVTGATQTCNGVLDMINTDLRFYMTLLKENQENLRNKGRLE